MYICIYAYHYFIEYCYSLTGNVQFADICNSWQHFPQHTLGISLQFLSSPVCCVFGEWHIACRPFMQCLPKQLGRCIWNTAFVEQFVMCHLTFPRIVQDCPGCSCPMYLVHSLRLLLIFILTSCWLNVMLLIMSEFP